MDSTSFLPIDIANWLVRYGIFLAEAAFAVLLLLALFKPFWNWLSGRSETNDRLRTLVDLQRRTLTELEVLNKTLTRTLKKKSTPSGDPSGTKDPMSNSEDVKPAVPFVVNEDRKKALLDALAKTQASRTPSKKIQKPEDEDKDL